MRIKLTGIKAFFSCMVAALWLGACATAPYEPAALESIPFQDRAQTQMQGPVTVRAAVPSPEETQALFDLPLYESGIQPVWLEVRNGTDTQMRYAPVGTDPDYFSPQEVAYVHRGGFSKEGRVAMNRYFYDMGMSRRIPPGESRSGFVFTHARPGTKSFNVDLFGTSRDNDLSFTFFIDVPGFAPDHSDAYFEELYSADEIRDLSRAELRSELAALDNYTRDKTGQQKGTPINVIVIGEPLEVLQVLIRANWIERPRTEAELASTVEYFYDRPADVVFTTNRDASGERNELRFWLSPMREEGVPVWLAQATHHIGQGKGRSQLDPDLDDAATFFMQDIWYGQGLARFGWVKVQGGVAFENATQTFAGSEYFTSGHLAVMWLSGPTVSMLDMDLLDWDVGPVGGQQP